MKMSQKYWKSVQISHQHYLIIKNDCSNDIIVIRSNIKEANIYEKY